MSENIFQFLIGFLGAMCIGLYGMIGGVMIGKKGN